MDDRQAAAVARTSWNASLKGVQPYLFMVIERCGERAAPG